MLCHAMQAISKTYCAVPGRLEWAVQVGCGFNLLSLVSPVHSDGCIASNFNFMGPIMELLGVPVRSLSIIVDSSFTDHLLNLVFRPFAVGFVPTFPSGLLEGVGDELV